MRQGANLSEEAAGPNQSYLEDGYPFPRGRLTKTRDTQPKRGNVVHVLQACACGYGCAGAGACPVVVRRLSCRALH